MDRRKFLQLTTIASVSSTTSSCSEKPKEPFFSKKIKRQRPDINLNPNIKTPETPEGINILGNINQFGANTRESQILLALRYKNITDTIEEKYNLPPGIILAMIIQESHGADLICNAGNDGGIGLSHMQPSTSTSFGLKCYEGNTRLIDRKHGHKLRKLVNQCKHRQKNTKDARADIELAEKDDRFNPILNIDAVGRILGCYMHDAKPRSGEGPLRYALRRYSGRPFSGKEGYGHHIFENMSYLYDQEWIKKLEEKFNKHNANKTINGKILTFETYLQEHQEYNHAFGLSDLSNEHYKPNHSEKALDSFHTFVKRKGEHHATKSEVSYFKNNYNFDETSPLNVKHIGIGIGVITVALLFRKKLGQLLR